MFLKHKCNTQKYEILEENIGEMLHNLGQTKVYIYIKPQPHRQQKQDRWDPIKLKSFCTAKEAINRVKQQLQNGRKYLQTTHLSQGQYP
jgi:conjugal transfer/entry exclusion protein